MILLNLLNPSTFREKSNKLLFSFPENYKLHEIGDDLEIFVMVGISFVFTTREGSNNCMIIVGGISWRTSHGYYIFFLNL